MKFFSNDKALYHEKNAFGTNYGSGSSLSLFADIVLAHAYLESSLWCKWRTP
jgi:hypothetical protein